MRVGIIGCGFVSAYNVTAWQKLGHKVIAVCDMNREAAWKLVSSHSHFNRGDVRIYTDSKEMYSKENLDAVSVCTPPTSHFNIIQEAVFHGCLAVVEKPYVMTEEEALILAVRGSNKICILHTQLYESYYREALKLVDEGLLGKVFDVSVKTMATPEDYMTRDPLNWSHRLVGGRIAECLSHSVYISQAFSGQDDLMVQSAWAEKSNLPSVAHLTYDELWAVLYQSGVKCTINVRLNAPFRDVAATTICGEKGMMMVGIVPEGIAAIGYDKDFRFKVPKKIGGDTRAEIIKDFLDGKCRFTASHGLFNVRVVENIVRRVVSNCSI